MVPNFKKINCKWKLIFFFLFYSMQQHVRQHNGFRTKLCDCDIEPKIFQQYYKLCLQSSSDKNWNCIPATGVDVGVLEPQEIGLAISDCVNVNEKKKAIDTVSPSGSQITQKTPESNLADEILRKQTALLQTVKPNTTRFKPTNSIEIAKKPFVAKRIEAPKMSMKSRLSIKSRLSLPSPRSIVSASQTDRKESGNKISIKISTFNTIFKNALLFYQISFSNKKSSF